MTPKTSAHIIKGMQKDTSKSKLSKEFAFDAKNIRITAREDDSLLSITNEKGNEVVNNLEGNYLGHCVLNNQVIFFFQREDDEGHFYDYIALCSNYNEETNSFETKEDLYDGEKKGSLNFNLNNPIETLGVYENEYIQKVYWVDGLNQPRVINIKASEEVKSKWTNTSFDFIPELALQESVSVEAISNSSLFAPGVIQYAFSYYNKYGQESNIFDVTPLCYIAHKERGASPEEVIKDIAFKIKVDNVDTNFDYIRIYSIHRTSLNAVPTVKRIIDLPISIPPSTIETTKSIDNYSVTGENKGFLYGKSLITNVLVSSAKTEGDTTIYEMSFALIPSGSHQTLTVVDAGVTIAEIEVIGTNFLYKETITTLPESTRTYITKSIEAGDYNTSFVLKEIIDNSNATPSIEYIDNGTLGETIDPTQLLYIGGEDIIAGTITQKDNTLFLGNIELKRLSIPEEIKETIKNSSNRVEIDQKYIDSTIKNDDLYKQSIINNNSYFRAGEHYRLGIQFQYKNGKWSEPIHIEDKTQAVTKRPGILEDGTIYLPSFRYNLDSTIKSQISDLGFKKMRGIVVLPESYERKIIAQGMLCPTVYNPEDRESNNPYSQSSWFLRPNIPYQINDEEEDGAFGFNNDTDNIYNGAVIEFRHGYPIITGANRGSEIQNEVEYKIDQSILTFHSPEIEFKDDVITSSDSNIRMKIVGVINFTSNYGDIDIQIKTPPAGNNAAGFLKQKLINVNSGETGLISGLFFEDKNLLSSSEEVNYRYLIYPWHRSASLNNDSSSLANTENRTQSAILEKKKISNIKFSKYNTWFPYNKVWEALGGNSLNSFANGISSIEKCNTDQVTLIKINQLDEEDINYYPNIDSLASKETRFSIINGLHNFDSVLSEGEKVNADAVRIKYKSSPHYVFKLNNSTIDNCPIILPCINNINKIKSEELVLTSSNIEESLGALILYKQNSIPNNAAVDELWIDTSYHADSYKENDNDVIIMKRVSTSNGNYGDWEVYDPQDYSDRCYYVISSNTAEVYKPYFRQYAGEIVHKAWKFESIKNITTNNTDNSQIKQDNLEINTPEYPYLYIAELYRDDNFITNIFGGNTEEAIKNNLWLPASQSVPISSNSIIYEYGDTRYQRYDCLKTYAFTPEDENQVIEIASFMCETRVNMLGRYDKNIGNLSNLNADPTNFNLFNPVYSQKDNFFNYRILDSDIYKLDNFPNSITWSKEKHLGEDVDTWTNITMANTLDLDGTKGKVNKLVTFNEKIFAFQDKGISNILFNSRVQIPVSDGVPIEITNGYKVEGSRYFSTELGCQNKYSIQVTPSGIYFLDSESGGIYLLGGEGLTNLSTNKGFDIWTKEVAYDSTFKTFYDKNNKDVYFVTKDYCLGYSEKLGQFTSFYDYNGVDTMFNVDSNFFSIKTVDHLYPYPLIWAQFKGEYNKIFNQIRPYSITYIENDEPLIDKVFTNIEYRADAFDSNNTYLADVSFDTITAWNEYQEGSDPLVFSKYKPSNLKKKFRMWRANIPRDKTKKLDRMRNPWLFIKLSKENPSNERIELHDMLVHYFQ